MLAHVPLFEGCSPVFLSALGMTLEPAVYSPGDFVIREGETGQEMFIINRGRVEVLNRGGETIEELGDGNFFGEIGVLLSEKRTASA